MEPKKEHLDTFAKYLINLAKHGQCLPLNLVAAAAKATQLSSVTLEACRKKLIADKRLVVKPFKKIAIIDGVFFEGDGIKRGTIADVQDALRKKGYWPVCDERVVKFPNKVPKGPMTHMMVGSRILTLYEAGRLAGLSDKKARALKKAD